MKERKIKEISIISGWHLINMNREINGHIASGWQPKGSLRYNQESDGYYQMMVKYELEPEKLVEKKSGNVNRRRNK